MGARTLARPGSQAAPLKNKDIDVDLLVAELKLPFLGSFLHRKYVYMSVYDSLKSDLAWACFATKGISGAEGQG